jgi:hypothetical protein
MAAYKTLNSQDIIISPLEVTKGFSFKGNALTASDVGIDRFLGAKFQTSSATGYITEYSQSAIYYSAQQLYYSNYISSSNGEVQISNTQSITPDGVTHGRVEANSFNNFTQTDLNPEKYWPTSSLSSYDPFIGVVSVPKAMFGDYILPNSLRITSDNIEYYDDGEGRLLLIKPNGSTLVVGNVTYGHGVIVFSGGANRSEGSSEYYGTAEYGVSLYGGRTINNSDIETFVNTTNITMSFSSSFTIYETQYKCTIEENDFNYSQNPTTISGSSNDGTVYAYVTGSYFSPYVTTVGLYNNDHELLAVGKLSQPLPTSRTTDTTILINIDRQ